MRRKKTERNHVPDRWKIVRLGDVADIAFSGVDKKTVEGEVPVELCNYTDVFYNRRIRVGMKLMTATATPVERDTWSLKKGDVLFTKDSETSDEIGVPSYVSDDMPNVLCGYHLGLARPSSDLVYGAFLARSLASRVSAQEFSRIANGVTRFGLTLDVTRNLPILLPPLPEQWAIAAVLDSIDDAIERTEAVIAATERLRSALLHELLTRGVPGWHTEWKNVPGIGTVPASWEVVWLGDVAEVRNGTTPSRARLDYWQGDEVPFVKTGQVNDVFIVEPDEFITSQAVTAGAVVVPKSSVLIAMIGQGKTRGMTARLGFDAAINQNFAAVYGADEDFSLAFFFAWARHNYSVIRALGQGSNQDALNCALIEGMRVPKPPVAEQRTIATMLDSIDEAIKHTRDEREELQSLKESTADALLTGRVRMGELNA